jgi:hypothetical protein
MQKVSMAFSLTTFCPSLGFPGPSQLFVLHWLTLAFNPVDIELPHQMSFLFKNMSHFPYPVEEIKADYSIFIIYDSLVTKQESKAVDDSQVMGKRWSCPKQRQQDQGGHTSLPLV